ncbi:hypothetical protein FB45DRAFT_921109, partial [Roridomyces roridus]
SGYESDTGARDNPTCQNFKTDTPVLKTIQFPVTSNNFKLLNREGRAICRIVHAHDWTALRIAHIFDIPPKRVKKAIQNEYAPPDVVSEDYERVKDPEFARYFPPVHSWSRPGSPLTAMEESEYSEYSEEEEEEETNNRRTVKKPPRNKYTSALPSFLANILHVDLSQHHALLVARGFTMPRLKIIASWPETAIKEALQRTLLVECEFTIEGEGEGSAAGGMTPFEVITLEFGLRLLKEQSPAFIPTNSSCKSSGHITRFH